MEYSDTATSRLIVARTTSLPGSLSLSISAYMNEKITPETVGRVARPGEASGNMINWRPHETILPMKHVERGSFIGGAIALMLGGLWTALIGNAIVDAIHGRALAGEIAMLLLFASPGIVTVLYGVGQFSFFHQITVDREKITVTTIGLRGRRQWSEPVGSYKGVLRQTRLSMPSEEEFTIGSTYNFTVRLAHAVRSKEIVLYETSSRYPFPPPAWEQQWYFYAQCLQLPRLDDPVKG